MKRLTSVVLGLALCGVAWAGPRAEDARDPAIEVRTVRASGPMIGVELMELNPELRAHFGAGDAGMLVAAVFEGSPAEAAGIAVGDVLVQVGDTPIVEWHDARSAVNDAAGGDVKVQVVRDGHRKALTAAIPQATGDETVQVGRGLFIQPDGHAFRFEADDWDDLADRFDLDKHDWEVDVDDFNDAVRDDLDAHMGDLSLQLDEMDARIHESLDAMELRLQELEQRIDEQTRKGDFWNGAQ